MAGLSARQIVARSESEADFTTWVLQAAHVLGWKSAHFRPAKTERGWRTPVQGDGVGFPDLVLIHPHGGLLVVELKREVGTVRPAQAGWIALWRGAGVRCCVWRPSMREEIHTSLLHTQRTDQSD